MRYRLGLCAAFEQRLGGAAVERVAAALEQAVVGRIANQRVLETIGRRGRRAFDEHEIGLDEAFERGLQGGLIQPADLAEQRKGKIAAQNRADLRDFPCVSKPIEPRRKRLLEVGGIAGMSLSSPRSRSSRVTSSTNRGSPPVRSPTRSTKISGSAW